LSYVREHGVRYTVNAGDPLLRKRIAAHYDYPQLGGSENICITTGSQEATYAVLQTLLDPARDELLVVEPAFPSYAKMARLQGAAVRSAPLGEDDDFAFDAERILHAVHPHTRLIVVCSPCNPTARVISRADVESLSEGLLRRGGETVWVLHDEVYREQTYVQDAGHFAAAYPYTIVTNSLSKSNALTGLRLGWAMAPDDVMPSIVKVHAWLTSCADSFAQRVAISIFGTPGGIREHARWYAERREEVVQLLAASGLRFIAPEGTFYACVRLPSDASSLAAAHALADRYDVVAIPGIAFGACFAQWLRLSWVGPLEAVREGLSRIASFVEGECA